MCTCNIDTQVKNTSEKLDKAAKELGTVTDQGVKTTASGKLSFAQALADSAVEKAKAGHCEGASEALAGANRILATATRALHEGTTPKCDLDKDLAASKKLEDKAIKHLGAAKFSTATVMARNALDNMEPYRTQAVKEAAQGHCEEARSLVNMADARVSQLLSQVPKKSALERAWGFVRDHIIR